MNVFYCDEDPHKAAAALADRHVVKMCLEAAQILSTAARAIAGDEAADALGLYRATHKAHPVTVEVVRCEHYRGWVYRWAHALGAEYRRRYGRTHKSAAVATAAASLLAVDGLSLDAYPAPWDVPQCMPEEHRGDDPVSAYRVYLRAKYTEWGDRARWTARERPAWTREEVADG